ncbi:MAG: hypothetical protein U0R80_08865 [Nocardioidaceae bacterium]
MTPTRRLLVCLGVLLLGLVTGLAAVLVHDRWWGLLVAVAGTLAGLRLVQRGLLRFCYVAGWVLVVVLASVPRPDYLVSADLEGYLLLALAPVLVVVALVTSPPPRRASRHIG